MTTPADVFVAGWSDYAVVPYVVGLFAFLGMVGLGVRWARRAGSQV